MTANRSPWCFRPEAGLADRVQQFMKREDIGKTDALHRLMEHGLKAEGLEAPKPPTVEDRWAV